MNDSYHIGLIVSLFILLGFSAFFSACEMAFSSLNRIKLKHLAEKNRRARLALKLLGAYDKLLSTVLIGNTIVNIASSALATLLFVGLLGSRGVSAATAVMTLGVLLFGEISPKTLAKESPELTALRFAPLMRVFMFLFRPLNFFASAWKRLIVKLFPVKGDRSVTEDELLTFVGEVREEGGINRLEEEMIRQVIEFDDLTAGDIFTPRVDLAAVPENAPPEEIDGKFAETGFSRLPVYQGSVDKITGVILLKDFHHQVMKKGRLPGEIIKPAVFVTRTMKISTLLRTLQRKRAHLAVLVDEFGGTLGIVTIEDIVEELVGEIWDEHDQVVEPIKKTGGGQLRALGSAGFRELCALAGVEAGEGAAEGAAGIPNTTVGNWVMETLGRLPRQGEEFTWRNLRVKITRVMRHRVMEASVQVIPASSGE
jgi:CBS domain containing-hemolysin-like protein